MQLDLDEEMCGSLQKEFPRVLCMGHVTCCTCKSLSIHVLFILQVLV